MKHSWNRKISGLLAAVMLFTMLPMTAMAEESAPNADPAAATVPAEKYTVALTATDGGRVSGGGAYAEGEEVTAAAHPADGYQFDGWYDGGRLVSLAPVYTFAAAETVSYQAAFTAAAGEKRRLTVTCDADYTSSVTLTDGKADLDLGTSVTLTFTDTTKEFLYWVNESNNILSTSAEYSFTLAGDTTITAKYVEIDNTKTRVIFRNAFSKIIFDESVDKNAENLSAALDAGLSATPSKMGHTFLGWYLADENGELPETNPTPADGESIATAVSSSSRVVVLPRYKAIDSTYSITVTCVNEDGTEIPGASVNTIAGVKVGQKQNVSAPKMENMTFQCWKIGDKIVGYDSVYTVLRAEAKNVALTAVYGDAVALKPIVNITQTYATREGGKYVISNTMQYYLPEGYQLLEAGFVYGTSYAKFGTGNGESNLYIGANSTKRSVDSNTANRGLYTFNGKTANPATTLYIKAYIIYKNTDTGEVPEPVYSAMGADSYYSLTATEIEQSESSTPAVSVKEKNEIKETAQTVIVTQKENDTVAATATVPQGVKLANDVAVSNGIVTLTVATEETTETNPHSISLASQESINYSVSITGVDGNSNAISAISEDNTTPILICLKSALDSGLTEVTAYHNGVPINPGASPALKDADTFYYDPTTGDVYICVTHFSNFTFGYQGKYEATLDPNEGTFTTAPAAVAVTYGSPMPELPADAIPTREGHTFLGYFDAKENGTQYYNADGTSARTWNKSASATLYARWVQNGTVRFAFLNTDKYLYRVGNQNPVALSSLFATTGEVAAVSVETVTGASGEYSNGSLTFSGTGVVKVTVTMKYGGASATLPLEVVEAINATNATSATGNNVVLLNDVTTSGTITVSSGKTLYGNGFKMTFTGTGSRPDNKTTDFTYGYVTLNSGALESVQIICPMFGHSYGLITANVGTQTGGQYPEMMSAVSASGDSIISNCYIKGARTNVFSISGNVKLENTVCECGATANIQLWGGSSDTLTLDGVTTIQYLRNGVYGAGILVGTNDSASNTKLVINDLTQYNWINSTAGITNSEYISEAVKEALKQDNYLHNGYVNMGVIYLNTHTAQIVDNRNNASDYDQGDISITKLGATLSGQFYTVKSSANVSVETKDSAYAYQVNTNGLYRPVIVFDFTTDNENLSRDGGVVKVLLDDENPNMEVNFAAMFSAEKYTALQGTVTCVNAANVQQTVINGCLTFAVPGRYYVTYTVEDNAVYDKDGNKTQQSVCYEKTIPVDVTMVNSSIHDAELEFNQATQKFYYYPEQEGFNTYYVQYIPLLNGLKIYDYDGENQKYLVFDGDSTEYTQASKIVRVDHENTTEGSNRVSVTTFYFNNGGHLEMKYRSDANSGKGSTASTSIKKGTDNRLYAVEDANTGASDSAFYWPIFYYKYTGNSGKTITVNGNNSRTTSTEGLDLSKAVNNASGRTTELSGRNEIMLFNEDQNPRNGIVFIGSGSLKLTKEKTSNDASGYYCYHYGYRAQQGSLGKDDFTDFSPDVYKITLNANAADANQTKDYILTTGAVNNATGTISRDGFTFGGWYTASVGGDKVGNQTLEDNQWTLSGYNVTADTTLYAHWLKPVTITFDTQGGDPINAEQTQSSLHISLPTPTKLNSNFKGWYDAAGNGDGTGAIYKAAGGETYYAPEQDVTLYAHWENLGTSYTVTLVYDDGSGKEETVPYTGDSITLPDPKYPDGGDARATFEGWYIGNEMYTGGSSYSPSSDVTLTAKWKDKYYTISTSCNTSRCSISTKGDLTKVPYNATMTKNSKNLTISGTYINNQSYSATITCTPNSGATFKGWYTDSGKKTNIANSTTITQNYSVYGYSENGCLAPGTLITLADGTQKPIESVTSGENVRSWDFFTGEYVNQSLAYMVDHGEQEYSVVNLSFSDGTYLRIIGTHGVFDLDINQFAFINEENCQSFVGHHFMKSNPDGGYESVQLESAVITDETTHAYSLTAAYSSNVFAENLLTVGPPEEFYSWMKMGDTLRYDVEDFNAKLEQYGTYDYSVFADYLTEEQFIRYNGKYLRIAVESGAFTFDQLLAWIEEFDQDMLK